MNDLHKHIAELSPEKRKLLEALLQKEEQIDITQSLIIPLKRDSNVLPVSFAQQRLWLLDQLDPGSAFYNIPLAMHLKGQLDVAALKQSIAAIVERHETLRTTFTTVDGQPMQLVASHLDLPLPVIDLQDASEAEREAHTNQLALDEAAQPFDLQRGPLLRTKLVRINSREHHLLVTMHHIIADGWSTGIFIRELAALYDAATRGQSHPESAPLGPEGTPLPIQYADFAHWQRQWLEDSKIQQQLSYWQRQLANVPVLALPTDRLPAPAQTFTFRGARQTLTLSPTQTAALKALAQREGTTFFVVLLAAFQVLLARYSGQDDFTVGTPIAGRKRDELEGLIGFFNNMLVLRTSLAGNPSFRELLQRAHRVALDAYEHQDVPFEKLVEEIQPNGSLSRSPLFQVLFALQNVPLPQIDLSSLSLREIETHSGAAKYDLSLSLKDTPNGLLGRLHYNAELFDEPTIERFIAHYLLLLEQLVADPTQRIHDVALLTKAERHHLLVAFNATARPYPSEHCLHQLFDAQAERTPDAVAVVFEDQALTYRQLAARANQLAHKLRELGVGPESCVAIYMEQSLDLIAGLLGVLKAGGAYIPLDPAYPQERLSYIMQDAQVAVVLTQAALRAHLPNPAVPVLDCDILAAALEHYPSTPPPVNLTPDHPACIIYTSGSTGTPKGVLIHHRGVINRLQWMWTAYPFGPDERCCQKTALSFVDSIGELFGPLLQGVPVWVIAHDVVKDPAQLVQTLAEQQITRIVVVPALLRIILDTHPALHRHLPRLRYWISSGEALPLDLAQRFVEQMPDATLLNLYGSTEVLADATCYAMRQVELLERVPVGSPIANMTAYVLDRHMQPVPIGVTGEIHIGGVGLARGYLNCPALTAERFIPNPFSAGSSGHPGARLYKTGDLGCYRVDGTLECLGRLDQQIKLHGFRIELGEIERMLLQHPAVGEAVVTAQHDPSGDLRLVAYMVKNQERVPHGCPLGMGARQSENQDLPGSTELREFLQARLPNYMVPTMFVGIDALPLTSSGKIDRHALPAPDWTQTHLGTAFVAPRTAIEEALANIWGKVLNLEHVSVEDSFFDLGGHSLKAALLLSRVREAFQVNLPLGGMFKTPTIAAMAELLIANETKPGQTEKIAQMLKRIKGTSPDDLRKLLEQKRRERNNA